MGRVSIIIPVYNVEKYLDRCMESVLGQTYANMEIILVDDGSKDNSGAICDKYAEQDSRIQVIHKENAGLGMARNSGLDIASGKYVTFIDSDDYIGKTHVADMITAMVNEQADTCMAGFTKVYVDSSVPHLHVDSNKVYEGDCIKKVLLPKMCGANNAGVDYIEMSVCMAMLSNEVIQNRKLRFVSERELISEDLVFDFDYYPSCSRVCVINNTDYFYCDNEGSLTTKYKPNRYEMQVRLYKEIMKKAVNLSIEEECKPRLDSTLVSIARYSIKLEEKFIRQNGFGTAKKNITEICSSSILQRIVRELDTTELKKSSKTVNLLIKRKMVLLLMATMKLKNTFNI